MRVVEGDVGDIEAGDHLHAFDQRREVRAAIQGLMHAAAGHREVEMLRVARVDDDRMQLGPSGVPSCTVPNHWRYCGSSLMQENGAQLRPPSGERNRPCGEVPAYQTSGSLACAGASQKLWSTLRASRPFLAGPKAGGVSASCQVSPRSVERKIVGPRWPVFAAASSVRPSRGSSTRWLMMWPRKCDHRPASSGGRHRHGSSRHPCGWPPAALGGLPTCVVPSLPFVSGRHAAPSPGERPQEVSFRCRAEIATGHSSRRFRPSP